MSTVIKYKIYCNTEQQFVDCYGVSHPTTCPNDTTHEVNPDSWQELESYAATAVTIQEEENLGATGGHFGAQSFSFSAAANMTTSYYTSFPYNVSLLTCQLQVSPDMIGDQIYFGMGPNTTVGTLAADAATGATTVAVSPTVIQHAYVGLEFQLTDGTNTDECGRIIVIDTVNSTVTFENAVTHNYNAIVPTQIRVTRYYLRDYYLAVTGTHKLGYGKIGASTVPKNTQGVCKYVNTSTTVKQVTFLCEHLY